MGKSFDNTRIDFRYSRNRIRALVRMLTYALCVGVEKWEESDECKTPEWPFERGHTITHRWGNNEEQGREQPCSGNTAESKTMLEIRNEVAPRSGKWRWRTTRKHRGHFDTGAIERRVPKTTHNRSNNAPSPSANKGFYIAGRNVRYIRNSYHIIERVPNANKRSSQSKEKSSDSSLFGENFECKIKSVDKSKMSYRDIVVERLFGRKQCSSSGVSSTW